MQTKTVVEKRLFWFLKEGTSLDLSNTSHLDMFVQQTLAHGKSIDVKRLLRTVEPSTFIESFNRVKSFLPQQVRLFWEEMIGHTH